MSLHQIVVATKQLIIFCLRNLFKHLDTLLESILCLILVDVIVNDTHLLISQGKSQGIITLLGIITHFFCFSKGCLRLTIVGVTFAEVAPGLIVGVPPLMLFHPVALFDSLRLQQVPFFLIVDDGELTVTRSLFVILVTL